MIYISSDYIVRQTIKQLIIIGIVFELILCYDINYIMTNLWLIFSRSARLHNYEDHDILLHYNDYGASWVI